MTDILQQIAAYKRLEADSRKAATPQAGIEALARQASPPRGFRRALEAATGVSRLQRAA